MSQAAVQARKAAKKAAARAARLDVEFAALERDAAADAMLVACESCGLVQVEAVEVKAFRLSGEWIVPDKSCVVCGCETGRFAGSI